MTSKIEQSGQSNFSLNLGKLLRVFVDDSRTFNELYMLSTKPAAN